MLTTMDRTTLPHAIRPYRAAQDRAWCQV